MSSLLIAAVVAGSFLGSLSMDMGLNVFQDYYHVFYQDAFWNSAKLLPATADQDADLQTMLGDDGFGVSLVNDRAEESPTLVR